MTEWKQNFRHFLHIYYKWRTEISFWHKYSDALLWHLKFSSGSSPVSWSSLRCCYTSTGVHLWWSQLIGTGVKRHTPVSTWGITADDAYQSQNHEDEELPARHRYSLSMSIRLRHNKMWKQWRSEKILNVL